MKKIILLLIIIISTSVKAQNSTDYIEEVFAIFKIKSFNFKNNTKNCEIITYIRVAEQYKQATYYVELVADDMNEPIFSEPINFNNLSSARVKSQRNKKEVYEFNFGKYRISEYAKMRLVIAYKDGSSSVLPIEMTDYKNPITILN